MARFKVPVLCYHSMSEADRDSFEGNLLSIERSGFSVISLRTLIDAIRGVNSLPRDGEKLVAITFDDGADIDYIDFPAERSMRSKLLDYQRRAGSRQEREPLATSFVIASHQARSEIHPGGGMGDHWWRECAATGIISLGNHSWDHTHPNVSGVAEDLKGTFFGIDKFDAAEAQIRRAREEIHRISGADCDIFAYPYGHVSEYLSKEYFPHRQSDHVAAVTTFPDYVTESSNLWELPRFVSSEHCHPHLMVIWNGDLVAEDEKSSLTEQVKALGGF
jgi:peptidoglycan/xylan/chitin deacetylase (PgdA/CDA1 family)